MIFLEPYKKYADVSGRTARLEFFSFSIFLIVVTLILVGLDILLGTFDEANSTGLLSGLFSLFSLIPSFTVTVRRLHDIDRSAWWMLILFIPLIGLIWLMVIMSFDSTAGDNRFGKNPKKWGGARKLSAPRENNVGKQKKRKGWLSYFMSFLIPGLGQIYCGRWQRGVTWAVLWMLGTYGVLVSVVIFSESADIRWISIPIRWVIRALGGSGSVVATFAENEAYQLHLALGMLILLFPLSAIPCALDALYISKRSSHNYKLQPCNKWYVYCGWWVLLLYGMMPLGLYCVDEYIVGKFSVSDTLMRPTILAGDVVFVNRVYYRTHQPVRGDIIIYRHDKEKTKLLLKRIIGMPSDQITIQNNIVHVNGKPFGATSLRFVDTITVPPNAYFVLGDNRLKHSFSLDNRFSGYVFSRDIVGKVHSRVFVSQFPNCREITKKRCFRIHRTGELIQIDEFGAYLERKVLMERYWNGKEMLETIYKNGRLEGPFRAWHTNGRRSEEGSYKDGKLEGPFRAWYENGRKQGVTAYKDGKLDGPYTEWDKRGSIVKRTTYRSGLEVP